ncbi:hypothetical protein [Streptomyces sp. NPDC088794]|uniref:hypothetical protein n=1 Tax=Streptomyces sp. NPDC088794 TaxID=3365902 RepID=UPI0038034F52
MARRVRLSLSASFAMLMTVSALAACGTGADDEPARQQAKNTSGPKARTLSEAELEQAAVTAGDLAGYEVQTTLTATYASHKKADPDACAPLMRAVGGSSGYAATARVGRTVFPKKQGSGAQVILSSHSAADAVRVMEAVRTAAERCEGFKDVTADLSYEDVEVRPDAGLGDESVSLGMTQLVSGDDVRVPYAVVAVRQGATVAMFRTFNNPSRPGGKKAAVVPETVIEAQLRKIAL